MSYSLLYTSCCYTHTVCSKTRSYSCQKLPCTTRISYPHFFTGISLNEHTNVKEKITRPVTLKPASKQRAIVSGNIPHSALLEQGQVVFFYYVKAQNSFSQGCDHFLSAYLQNGLYAMLIVQLALISLGFLKKWRESKAYQKASHCIKHFTIKQHAATFFFFFTNCLVI